MACILRTVVLLVLAANSATALDNGLARTPPMGWLSWQRFRCNIDCQHDPHNCISEKLYMEIADHLAADGYREAGYVYVNIDDCWPSKQRDPQTMELIPDPVRFPSGIKALADYPDYPKIAKFCNIWRNFDDIDDSWDSVKSIIKYYGDDKGNFSAVAGPGNYNDPDMIIVGDKGLSPSQAQAQMALWAMMAAPLFISSDLRNIDNASRSLLLNRGVIAINQDQLGIMGKRIWQVNNIETWLRPVTPQGSYAVAVLNINSGGYTTPVSFSLRDLGVKENGHYNVTEVFTGSVVGSYTADKVLSVNLDVSSVFLCKFTKTSDLKP